MNILKEILGGKNDFKLDLDNNLFVLNVHLSKQYTLKELAFFLPTHNKPYRFYLNICKEKDVQPIPNEDTKNILDYIQNYQIPSIIYDSISYKTKLDYSFINSLSTQTKQGIEIKSRKFYIVLPDNIKSPININNIKEFTINKRYQHVESDSNLSVDDSINFTWNKYQFKAINNIDHFTSEDWCNIVCIFMDNSKWQIKNWAKQNLVEIINEYPCFCVSENGIKKSWLSDYNVKSIKVNRESGIIENYSIFENVIMEFINKK